MRLNPDLVEVRVNLGIALTKQHQNQEALEQFREVLKRSPTNSVALEYVSALTQGQAN